MPQWNYQFNQPNNQNIGGDDFTNILEGLTKEELQELMENEDRINEIVCDYEKIKKIKLDKELIQAENRSIADHNLSKEPRLNDLRETLAATYVQIKDSHDTFQTNQAKLESIRKDINLETTLAVLQTKCAQTEEESEDLAESLFNGDLPIGDFLTSFKEKRTLAHMRRIKSEKMRELLLQMQREETANIPAVPPRQPNPYPDAYRAQPNTKYPGNNFAQPTGQQYPSYNWK